LLRSGELKIERTWSEGQRKEGAGADRKAAYIARLRAGETVSFREGGNWMTPRIKHRQKCTYAPVTSAEDVTVGNAVFCKVRRNYFTHLITAVKGEQYQISNNHGHVNGWITLTSIFGKVTAIEE
jgi:hypothetical protein